MDSERLPGRPRAGRQAANCPHSRHLLLQKDRPDPGLLPSRLTLLLGAGENTRAGKGAIVQGFTSSQLQEKIRTLRAVMLATRDVAEAEECAISIDHYCWLLACLLQEESASGPSRAVRSAPPSLRLVSSTRSQASRS